MWHGRDGIRILESGLADRFSRLASALESAGSAALDGDGGIGDSTGMAGTRFMAAPGISREAGRSITAAISTAAESGAVRLSIAESERGRSRETGVRLAATPRRAARAAYGRARSAATIMAESRRAIRHGVVPASVVEVEPAAADLMAAAGGVDRGLDPRNNDPKLMIRGH